MIFNERIKLMAKDPICGMDVDPKTAVNKSEYNGQMYYFCSPGCKKDFDLDPKKYTMPADHNQHQHHHS